VPVDGAARDVRGGGDILERGVRDTLLMEDALGGIEDVGAGSLGFCLGAADHLTYIQECM
jgi:hypothetical protein